MTTPRVISRESNSADLDTDYKWGFTIDIESDLAPKGLNEDIVRLISAKKQEPEWMLEWRLKAYHHWERLNFEPPKWANIQHDPIDYQDIYYYAAPPPKTPPRAWTRWTPRCWGLRKTRHSPPGKGTLGRASPWTPFSTACRWPLPTRTCWRRPALSFAP